WRPLYNVTVNFYLAYATMDGGQSMLLKSLQGLLWLDKPNIWSPETEGGDRRQARRLLPYECRQSGTSYTGKFYLDVCFQWNGGDVTREKFNFGRLPIMLKSHLCNLSDAKPGRLIELKEEATEMGGYFICNGLERLIRLLIMPKRNHPLGVQRSSYRNRGPEFTDKAVVTRCTRADQSSVTNRLYYLHNGNATLGFSMRRREYLIPVGIVLKALIDTSDRELYLQLTSTFNERYQGQKGAVGTQLVCQRVEIILDEVRRYALFTRLQCLKFIGERFQPMLEGMETENHYVVGERVIMDYILVHLDRCSDKFNFLIFMLQKLFALVDQTAAPDNPDTLQNHEVLLPGHLLTIFLKEKLQEWLFKFRTQLQREMQDSSSEFVLQDINKLKKVMEKVPPASISKIIENMLNTGNLNSQSGLDLQQSSGMTVIAEKLNFFRFLSHFRSVHRGAYFAQMRTTTVRKLLPESWGFMCPVHTPDGSPCGLLNHLTATCRITSDTDSELNFKDFVKIQKSITNVLIDFGMIPVLPRLECGGPPEVLSVLLDGRVIGYLTSLKIEAAVQHLRSSKLSKESGVPEDLEVGYVPCTYAGAYPGLYLFTTSARFIRPVKNLQTTNKDHPDIELIGPFEQAYMEIKCMDGGNGGRREDAVPASHQELHPTAMLSVVASITPWSDHNQSPRNMYQCQMAKQTMGFPSQSIQFRSDNKLYRLQTPQSPIAQTVGYEKYNIDEFPTGTNAIVAVLAYTGYDMEDAMILNKSSVERGMCHGQIYQTETIDLTEKQERHDGILKLFARTNKDASLSRFVDTDGLPYIGQILQSGDPYCNVHNTVTTLSKTHKLKGSEIAVVDYVAAIGTKPKDPLQKVKIRVRRGRNPIIGDKFSSRHGQKGVCSQLWPDVDMPFSAVTGMRPDLIINPHAFPSRMTIGMLLESIAAKGGSLEGKFVDATPFARLIGKRHTKKKHGSGSAVDDYGQILASYGFNFHGTEVLYSGLLGTELTCEIFIGPVYYQRLRHMVSDKFQVRSMGPVNPITRQPVKGRKVGGGIRFGEMERDSILAHGAAYLLRDRLHISSDYHVADVCSKCGGLLSASPVLQKERSDALTTLPLGGINAKKITCNVCKSSQAMETVAMPYVFRYLAAELAAMNIKMALKVSDAA
ncbi:hypothetical protein KI387_025712, partial [Taxus chinensis]